MKYNRTSEIIGGCGVIGIALAMVVVVMQNISHAATGVEPSYLLAIILMGSGAILTLTGLLTGGFEKQDALVSGGDE